MTETPKTEDTAANAAKPGRAVPKIAPGPQPAPAAAAAPCECAGRLNELEGQFAAFQSLTKSLSWLFLAAGAAIIYILWTGSGNGGAGK